MREMPWPPRRSSLVMQLAHITAKLPRERKLLIARTRGEGKELLRQVVLGGQSWIGFEVETVRSLAMKIAAPRLAALDLRVIDDFDDQSIAERAIDQALSDTSKSGPRERFPGLAEKVGFRQAVQRSVATLRQTGIRSRQVLAAGPAIQQGRQALIGAVLGHVESILDREHLADRATVLETARDIVAGEGTPVLAGASVFLVPGLIRHGLEDGFLEALQSAGATVLTTDPVEGMAPPVGTLWLGDRANAQGSYLHAVGHWASLIQAGPGGVAHAEGASVATSPPKGPKRRLRPAQTLEIELFAAGSVYDELRGVLRRVLERRAQWDEVEVIATDPVVYGSAMHALAESLDIPVTYAAGLPVERTRPGRIVSSFFRWIESDFQESVIRALIEATDIGPPKPQAWLAGPRLARALRRLRIGWGRARYLRRIQESRAALSRRPADPRGRQRDSVEGRADDLGALEALLGPVLDAIPDVRGRASAAQVATALRVLLKRCTEGTKTDQVAQDRLLRQLDRIRATLDRPTDFWSAAATVQSRLVIRVPAPQAAGTAPWSSAPGHLYLSDLQSGGATGRAHTFIVGLDSASLSASVREDPLLLDRERQRIGQGKLPFARDRALAVRFGFAGLFARLRGHVSLSYARWDPSEARAVAPAPEMLQALRLKRGDPACDFADLQRHLGPSESRLPGSLHPADLDASDVWLRALAASDGRLRDGVAAVSRAYPKLGRGIEAAKALDEESATVHAGFLGTHSPPLSYQTLSRRTWSSSRLEGLGACPRRFFFGNVLRIRPPDDPEFDGHRWLDPLQRGSLLHAVFESSLRAAAEKGLDVADPAFLALALECSEREIRRTVPDIPAPSPVVRDIEIAHMGQDVESFVTMIRETKPSWKALELAFGMDDEPVSLGIPPADPDSPATLLVRGYVDRVDFLGGDLRVVDYKTGGDYAYTRRQKTYRGGRRLQHVLYVAAVAQVMGLPVESMEYHFPTRKGENRIRDYPAAALAEGLSLIGTLMAAAENGEFPATDSAGEDCRFCDYQEICGVQVGSWGQLQCRLSDWTAHNMESLPELARFRQVRQWEDPQ